MVLVVGVACGGVVIVVGVVLGVAMALVVGVVCGHSGGRGLRSGHGLSGGCGMWS